MSPYWYMHAKYRMGFDMHFAWDSSLGYHAHMCPAPIIYSLSKFPLIFSPQGESPRSKSPSLPRSLVFSPRSKSPSLPRSLIPRGFLPQVQIPGTSHSFALIYSIEDPDGKNEHSGVGVQVRETSRGVAMKYSSPDEEDS